MYGSLVCEEKGGAMYGEELCVIDQGVPGPPTSGPPVDSNAVYTPKTKGIFASRYSL